MQYLIPAGTLPRSGVGALADAIATIDPSALVDLDALGSTLRVSTLATSDELLDCLHGAGMPVRAEQLQRVPSECCGGCAG